MFVSIGNLWKLCEKTLELFLFYQKIRTMLEDLQGWNNGLGNSFVLIYRIILMK